MSPHEALVLIALLLAIASEWASYRDERQALRWLESLRRYQSSRNTDK